MLAHVRYLFFRIQDREDALSRSLKVRPRFQLLLTRRVLLPDPVQRLLPTDLLQPKIGIVRGTLRGQAGRPCQRYCRHAAKCGHGAVLVKMNTHAAELTLIRAKSLVHMPSALSSHAPESPPALQVDKG